MTTRLAGPDARPDGAPDRRVDRERLAEEIAERLHTPVSVLGVIFLLVVLGEYLAPAESPISPVFTIVGWAIWAVFVVEFVARMIIAPSTGRFLRRNWWQAVFLLVPFLRFLALLRLGRAGRAVVSAVRAGRSARARLGSRLAWLGALTVIVILASGQLLFEFGAFETLEAALHASAVAAITGEPLGATSAFARVMDIVLAVYSVVVFATLAGSLGAFFLERSRAER